MQALRRIRGLRTLPIRSFSYYDPIHPLQPSNLLIDRHIGPNDTTREVMLSEIGLSSVDELIHKTLPKNLPKHTLDSWKPRSEEQILHELQELASENRALKNFIGAGYYNTFTPGVILRNVLQNPAWYTSYTPYQAEISQGRLQALLIYQTMVSSLTGMEISNCSLLDEATSAAEAMAMSYNIHGQKKSHFLVSEKVFPQVLAVIKTRAEPLGITVHVGDVESFDLKQYPLFGVLVQSPDNFGEIKDFSEFSNKVHESGATFMMGSDLLALCLSKSPGEMGVDICYGNSQRFGVPMGYGGPHAAFFSTKKEYIRKMPGRIIGVSKDSNGNVGLRMTMQTREQHIRKEKATSNICTAQALLANMAGLYSVYHGEEGLVRIANRAHSLASILRRNLEEIGYSTTTQNHFDTVTVKGVNASQILEEMEKKGINLRKVDESTVGVSFDETSRPEDAAELIELFATIKGTPKKVDVLKEFDSNPPVFPQSLSRHSEPLKHSIFKQKPSETTMLRFLHKLQNMDISLAKSMIPLGSCTMKLNATCQMMPITQKGFGEVHPFAPLHQVAGYQKLIEGLRRKLMNITGFDEISFQSNSGAQGEYSGLLTIRNYHRHNNQPQRNVCLVPTSAHGTNPASATMAGMKVITVKCDKEGNIDLEDIKAKAEQNKENLGALMVTYPSTNGIFDRVTEVIDIIHHYGGQVYMDGANMNAQVGLTAPGVIGADVCHLNLHKTFAIPHGGGGPGMGPIGVKKHLAPFLPGDIFYKLGGSGGQISSTHFGSASILPISWAYIEALGTQGLTESTKHAILNANYIRARLGKHYKVVFVGEEGQVAHELIIDLHQFKETSGVTEEDVAKRLIDYGYHSPTMSFPIPGTLMIEPTESEDKAELDRFCEAMINIRQEIKEIEEGVADKKNNVLKNAPHSVKEVVEGEWNKPYSREKAAFPLPWVLQRGKFWPTVGRVDNVYGDKNPVCVLPESGNYL